MKQKVAILSCATGGGAGIAAKRLADVLMERDDLACDFIDITSLGGLPEEAIYDGSATNRTISDTHFTAEHPGFVRQWLVDLLCAYDVINIHWATMLVTVSEILEIAKRGRNVVLTMHDFFYATGGCHYQAGCKGQSRGCTDCPQVDESIYSRHSVATAFEEKMTLLRHGNVTITAPSHYLAGKVRDLIGGTDDKVRVIRNPYSHPEGCSGPVSFDPDLARKVMVIADSFGERRKNIKLSIDAAVIAKQTLPSLELHLIGSPTPEVVQYCGESKLDFVLHGHISSAVELSRLYRTCGILITCSSDDNWPNILVEACAHGMVPVVGPGHGCEEFSVKYRYNFVAEDYSAGEFALKILQSSRYLRDQASLSERAAVTNGILDDHSSTRIGREYAEFFRMLSERILHK